jgi:hypothetical protein
LLNHYGQLYITELISLVYLVITKHIYVVYIYASSYLSDKLILIPPDLNNQEG